MKTTTCFCLAILVAGLSACQKEAQDPWGRRSDPFVAAAGERLESLERARGQEEGRRNRIVELASAWAGKIRGMTAGDPFAIDEAKRAGANVEEELAGKKANEDAKLKEPEAAAKAAQELLDAARIALAVASRADAEMNGTLAAGTQGQRCGSDGCGGNCGACEWSDVCLDLFCRCLPDCEGRECGPDDCGGVCGSGGCESGSVCIEQGRCSPLPAETVCRPDCRGVPAGPYQETRRARDFSARPSRKWKPEKLETLAEVEDYLSALKSRRAELDGLISGGDSLNRELAEVRSKLEQTRAAINQTGTEVAEGKKALSAATRDLKKLPEAERAAAEERLKGQADAHAAREAALSQLKTETRSLAAKAKELEGTTKKVLKDLPELQEGRRRIGPEIVRIEKGVEAWKELKARVAEQTRKVDEAKASVARAETELRQSAEEVAAAKTLLEEEYEPLLKLARERIEQLTQPAFGELLIGIAAPNGLNHESSYVLLLRDEGRLGRIVDTVSALRDSRKAAWEELTSEIRQNYPVWLKEMDWLDDYLQILAELDQSTKRSKALEKRLVEERERTLNAIEEGEPPAP